MLNLAKLLEDSTKNHPDKVAIIFGDNRFTYKQINTAANQVANSLVKANIQKGDKVALSCPNLPYFPIAYNGILKAGAAVVPLNILLKRDEVTYHLKDSDAKAYFCYEGNEQLPMGEEGYHGFQQATECEFMFFITADPKAASPKKEVQTLGQMMKRKSKTFNTAKTDASDTAVILYTSGTTGRPKGAELTHSNMVMNAKATLKLANYQKDDIGLIVLPLFHSFGQTFLMNGAMAMGSTNVVMPKFTPDAVLATMEKENVTFFAGVPTMYWALLNYPEADKYDLIKIAKNLRICASGGASLPIQVMKDFEKKFNAPILEGYGLSETSPVASFNRYDQPRKGGSIGLPIEGVEMQVVDENDKELPIGEKGEIVIKGHNVMKGYYNRPEANEKVFKNGWFHSGDVGIMDEDGYFYIVDRTKDMIIRGGYNVYPRELEEVMMEHSAVSLVAVIGVPHDSHGEEVKAYVVLKEVAKATVEELKAWCKKKMAAYKYPRIIEIATGLPMTATGKILKKELRAMSTEGEKKVARAKIVKTGNGVSKNLIASDMPLLKEHIPSSNGQAHSNKYERVFSLQKAHAQKLRTSTAEFRINKLMKLFHYLQEKTPELQEAMYKDFRRHPLESIITEVAGVLEEIGNFVENLEKWILPQEVPTPDSLAGAKGYIKYEPKGNVLIIAPWNYPFLLAVKPLVAAIAAGNTVIIKPSEMTPHVSAFLKKMIGELYKEKEVALFEGDAMIATELLKLPFNHIFFTGSPRVGKIIMKAAAENLASVTLELGGKSPAIVDKSAKINDVSGSIIWGKFMNSGQTCIAPDYVLVHKKKLNKLLAAMKNSIDNMYNSDGNGVVNSPYLCRIVNHNHFLRLKGLLEDAVSKGAIIVAGGEMNKKENFISPTIVTHVTPEMRLMQEEIFGPILPVIAFENKKEVTKYTNSGEKPLALYIFSRNDERTRYYLDKTSAGGTVINDTIVQYVYKNLPFGGVNNSGIGKGHGYYGFKAFSNERAVVEQKGLGFRPLFPPYDKSVADVLDQLLSQ